MRPDKNCAIFTTYDSSKGLERRICVLFDWTCDYWNSRKKFSDQSYIILRNIFCVAASRGKEKIIIVKNEDQLTWDTIKNPYDQITDIDTLDISKVFDYRKTEFIDTCFRCLETKPITNECQQSTINIKRQDGLIDLSPCIGIYQEAAFFDNYDINRQIELICKLKRLKNTISDEDDLWKKILFLTSLETGQNRYQTQISDCFISNDIWKEISSRLNERLEKNEQVQSNCLIECFNEMGEKIYDMVGCADVVKNGTVYELKFTGGLSHSHYLQCALYMIALNLDKGILWNIYTNEAYEIRIKDKKLFLNQLTEMITDGKEKKYKGPLLLEEDKNIELLDKAKILTNVSGFETYRTTNPIYYTYYNLEGKNNELKIIKQRDKEIINDAECFAIVDTDSTWNDINRLVNGEKYYDVAFSLGVIIADVNTCEAIEALYFIFDPECNEEGMYKNELELPPQEFIYKDSRDQCIKIIKDVFKELNVNRIFLYNASYDYDHLPELKDYTWHEIMSKAAYVQYNPWIKQNSDVYKTGRLKRGYGVEEIYKTITQQTSYKETHCALYDVMDELEIMKKLKHDPSTYDVFDREERKNNKNKSTKIINSKDSYVNSKKIMQCGLNATIVEYRSYRDIDIEFEDGVRVNNTNIDKWKRGTIDNPNIAVKQIIKKESIKNKESVKDRYIGKSRIMNCGMSATVIEYYNCDDITLKFEDRVIKKHCRADRWKEGKIRHP